MRTRWYDVIKSQISWMKEKRVLVLAGPTGVGESTITKKIIEMFPIFTRLVTATTRKPRLDEVDKKDYYFFTKQRFLREIENGNIIEYTYVKNRGVYYGSYRQDLTEKLDKGLNIVINLDVVGAKYYKEKYDAVTIFIEPENIERLRERIVKRDNNISDEELEKRMRNAKKEIENEAPFYDYRVLNETGKLNVAIKKVVDIIKNEGYRGV